MPSVIIEKIEMQEKKPRHLRISVEEKVNGVLYLAKDLRTRDMPLGEVSWLSVAVIHW
jgi:hypothetical protein